MNKKLNTILFIIGATILNVVLIIVVWVGLMRVTQVIIGAELYDQIFKNIIVVFMLLALVISFFLYRMIMKRVEKRIDMDKYFEPFFRRRK